MSNSVEQRIMAIVEPIITAKGLELVDVEYIKEGAHWYLRLYIDKDGGVDLDDCADISRAASEILDKEDPISQAYFLEVSSPGLERPLKKDEDFEKFKGSMVTVHTSESFRGFTEFTGHLVGLVGQEVILEYEEEKIQIPQKLIAAAHLFIEF